MVEHRYMDYAATTPAHPDVVKAMSPYFTEIFGNPSSIHYYGQEAKNAIESARAKLADFLGASPEEIIFTSGGTEADNTAVKGLAYAGDSKKNHIITSSIEHHAVLEPCHFLEKRGFNITYLPVDSFGMVDPNDVKKALNPRTLLITIMHASNEVGTVQPIADIGKIAREAGVPLHTDAVQTVGHIPVNVDELKIDMLSLSGHKIYGPKGVGALYVRAGIKLEPLLHGGGQEGGIRGSTYNVPGIVGLGKAVEIARQEMTAEAERQILLRDKLISRLMGKIENIHLNGHPVKRLPNNINLTIEFVEGESLLLSLDMAGISASTGSACSSESSEPSHVLTAMCIPPEKARCSLRFSLGRWTMPGDIEAVLETLPPIARKLRSMSPIAKPVLR
jgi:cysteine desulfurase